MVDDGRASVRENCDRSYRAGSGETIYNCAERLTHLRPLLRHPVGPETQMFSHYLFSTDTACAMASANLAPDILRGYDCDGVLVPRKVDPRGRFVVISGRQYTEWSRTVAELGTHAPIYLRPFGQYGDRQAAGEWKAQIILALGVQEFFEDDDYQASIIRERCPGCNVVLVQ